MILSTLRRIASGVLALPGAMLALAMLPAPLPASATEPPPVVTALRLAGDAARTRMVVDLDRTVDYRAFALAEPDRIVVDLPRVNFAVPVTQGNRGRGLVSAYRFGLITEDRSRIVLDLSGPAAIDSTFVLKPVDDQPARLVIDLVGVDRATFESALSMQQRPPLGSEPEPPPAPEPLRGKPVIVLDPGHGGIDSGAITPDGDLEKAIVLGFVKELAAKIEAEGRYDVVLTRRDDRFVSLGDRVRIAREAQASLFLSIHADTLSDPFGVRGATVYTLSERASDAEAARYAERENRADLIAGVDLAAEPDEVADILVDLTRRETKLFSNRFASTLVERLKSAATMNKNPHRSAGFIVLKAPDVPSVLIELGYLSNPQDVKLLVSPEWRDRATDAMLAAIDAFFAAGGGNAAN